jgi:hypothetical protein
MYNPKEDEYNTPQQISGINTNLVVKNTDLHED